MAVAFTTAQLGCGFAQPTDRQPPQDGHAGMKPSSMVDIKLTGSL
jgi:hypothetical protein